MRKFLVGAAVAGFAMLGTSQAQAQEAGAYHALHATPIGAVAPTAPNLGPQRTSFRAHYGRHDVGGNTNTFAGGVDFPAGMNTSFGFTLGYRTFPAGGQNHWMVGTHLAGNVVGATDGVRPAPGALGLGYKAELGYGRIENVDAFGAAVSAPISLSLGSGESRIVPFVSPGLGWGSWNAPNDNQSDIRFMLGGGLGLDVAGGTGIHLGARRIMATGAEMQYGLGVTLRTR